MSRRHVSRVSGFHQKQWLLGHRSFLSPQSEHIPFLCWFVTDLLKSYVWLTLDS